MRTIFRMGTASPVWFRRKLVQHSLANPRQPVGDCPHETTACPPGVGAKSPGEPGRSLTQRCVVAKLRQRLVFHFEVPKLASAVRQASHSPPGPPGYRIAKHGPAGAQPGAKSPQGDTKIVNGLGFLRIGLR